MGFIKRVGYVRTIAFKTGDEHEPSLDISTTSKLGFTGYRSKVFATGGEGLFFDMGFSGYHEFWMSQVAFDLDVIFIGEDYKVVEVVKGVANNERAFTSKSPALYVAETKYGWCEENNILEGTKVEFLGLWDSLLR